MKSFDLTFSGTVLPGCDPSQVKQGIAQLFAVQDDALLEEMFSGKTIVLRHNLDRKAAADYYRRISLLGGQAVLVKSPKHRAVHRDEILFLEPDSSTTPQIPVTSVPEQPAGIEVDRPDALLEQRRLQAITIKTEQESQLKEARLQRQKEQFDRIAAEELEKIERLDQVNRIGAQQELAELSTIGESASQSVSTQLLALENQNLLSKNRANQDIARLDVLIEEAGAGETAVIKHLNQCLKDTRRSVQEDIRRLHQLLHDAQHRAAVEIDGIEQQLLAEKARSHLEVKQLKRQKEEALYTMEEELKALVQQQEAAQEQFAQQTAALRQREQDVRTREREEASKLQAMAMDVKSKRDQGIANVEHAIDQLRTRTEATLQRLHTPQEVGACQQTPEPSDTPINHATEAKVLQFN